MTGRWIILVQKSTTTARGDTPGLGLKAKNFRLSLAVQSLGLAIKTLSLVLLCLALDLVHWGLINISG